MSFVELATGNLTRQHMHDKKTEHVHRSGGFQPTQSCTNFWRVGLLTDSRVLSRTTSTQKVAWLGVGDYTYGNGFTFTVSRLTQSLDCILHFAFLWTQCCFKAWMVTRTILWLKSSSAAAYARPHCRTSMPLAVSLQGLLPSTMAQAILLQGCGFCSAHMLHAFVTSMVVVSIAFDFIPCMHVLMTQAAGPIPEKPQQIQTFCPVCTKENDDYTLKNMYAIRSLKNGDHDEHIPRVWMKCPPARIEDRGPEMEALRNAIRERQVLEDSYLTGHEHRRQLQAKASELKVKLTKTEAKLQMWEERKLSIHHYLRVVADMSSTNVPDRPKVQQQDSAFLSSAHKRKRERYTKTHPPSHSQSSRAYNEQRQSSRDLMPPPSTSMRAVTTFRTPSWSAAHSLSSSESHFPSQLRNEGHRTQAHTEAVSNHRNVRQLGGYQNLPRSGSVHYELPRSRPSQELAQPVANEHDLHPRQMDRDNSMYDLQPRTGVLGSKPRRSHHSENDISNQQMLDEDPRHSTRPKVAPPTFQQVLVATPTGMLHVPGDSVRSIERAGSSVCTKQDSLRSVCAKSNPEPGGSSSDSPSFQHHQLREGSFTNPLLRGKVSPAYSRTSNFDSGHCDSSFRRSRATDKPRDAVTTFPLMSRMKHDSHYQTALPRAPHLCSQQIVYGQTSEQTLVPDTKLTYEYSQHSPLRTSVVRRQTSLARFKPVQARQLFATTGRLTLPTSVISKHKKSNPIHAQKDASYNAEVLVLCSASYLDDQNSGRRFNDSRTDSTDPVNCDSGGSRVLDGKFGIVTGASRGIGAAISENLAKKGCSLLLNYTSDSSAKITSQLATELRTKYGIQCHIVQADMGSESGPAHIVETAINHFAHPKTHNLQIDILINNAGIGGKHALGDGTASEFTKFYNVNVRGPLFLVQAAMPYLPHDRSGRIVNLSSVSSSCGFAGDGIYGGTKAALEAMTRTWARELAERATVNAVNPGPVATQMYAETSKEFQRSMSHWTRNTPLAGIRPEIDRKDLVEGAEDAGGRPGYDVEVAGVVAMLCTPDSAWCTGSVICANGGMKFTV
nr:l-xylulose reductase [Quercus suber]